MPAALPPLVTLELHGSGGVAVFADEAVTAYCLLVKEGDRLVSGGLMFPDIGGASVGVGTIGAGTAEGSSTGMVQTVAADGWLLTRMTTTYGGEPIGVLAGEVPPEAPRRGGRGRRRRRCRERGQGRFALWAPDDDAGQVVTVTAHDATGRSSGRVPHAATGRPSRHDDRRPVGRGGPTSRTSHRTPDVSSGVRPFPGERG